MKLTFSSLLFLLCVLTHHPLSAQQANERKQYSLAQLIPGNREFLSSYPAYINGLQWHGNKLMSFDEQNIRLESPSLSAKDRLLRQTATILEPRDLAKALPDFLSSSSITGYPQSINTGSGHELLLAYEQALCRYNMETKTIVGTFSTEVGRAELSISPSAEYATVVKDHNIYLLHATEITSPPTPPKQITTDGTEAIVYGEAVHQREFGIEKGMFWSPDGSKLAYYRMDQSMVAPYPLVNVSTRKATDSPIRYPMAGMPSHHVKVVIYDIASESSLYVQTNGDPEHYLTNLSWSPDGKTLYIAEVNRTQTHCTLQSYDSRTGQRQAVVFQEEDNTYVEPLHEPYFLPNKPEKFIWQSRRNGWNHLYLYDISGRLIRQLTNGEWEVTDFKGVDPEGRFAYYESTQASPIERKLYRVPISGGSPLCITPEYGVHRTQISADFSHIIDIYESPTVPRISRVISSDGKHTRNLLVATNPDTEYQMPEIIVGTIKAADGRTDLFYRMVKPLELDTNKKYPVIIYVYGGPHAQMIEGGWRHKAGGWDIYMAQQGYVVFTLDNRGSANRGKAFEQIIHRNLGVAEMADQMCGVNFLKTHPWIDPERIGVHGWSYGGFMSTNLMLTHPEVFKVGVAGGPVIDWSLYEIMYGERYMDTPEENPEGYQAALLSDRAANLKGRLMLIHGDIDPVVVWQHSLRFIQSCIKAGTYPDYMVYPGHEHNVSGPDRVHLYATITRYFNDHL